MDVQSNACDENVKTLSDVTAESNNTAADEDVARARTVSNETEKRPLEETDGCGDEGKRKKCKTDDDDDDDRGGPESMSKRQLKKLQKKQRWLEGEPKRKQIKKEKKKEKRKLKALIRESGVEIQKVKTCKMADSKCKQRIVLDMSYDDLMSDKDLCKCSSQLLRCYCVNRRMNNPMQFYVSSFEGKFKEVMSKHGGSENWDINYIQSSFDKNFKKEEIVYLTSDSSNVLDILDGNKVYIIGGLVDHNSCKGASLKVAENLGVAHARLPIDEYINMKTRKILTIIHVYEIMSKVVSGMSWKEAFISTIPKRKMFSAKDEEISLNNVDCSGNGNKEKNTCPVDEEKDDNHFPDINKKEDLILCC